MYRRIYINQHIRDFKFDTGDREKMEFACTRTIRPIFVAEELDPPERAERFRREARLARNSSSREGWPRRYIGAGERPPREKKKGKRSHDLTGSLPRRPARRRDGPRFERKSRGVGVESKGPRRRCAQCIRRCFSRWTSVIGATVHRDKMPKLRLSTLCKCPRVWEGV